MIRRFVITKCINNTSCLCLLVASRRDDFTSSRVNLSQEQTNRSKGELFSISWKKDRGVLGGAKDIKGEQYFVMVSHNTIKFWLPHPKLDRVPPERITITN